MWLVSGAAECKYGACFAAHAAGRSVQAWPFTPPCVCPLRIQTFGSCPALQGVSVGQGWYHRFYCCTRRRAVGPSVARTRPVTPSLFLCFLLLLHIMMWLVSGAAGRKSGSGLVSWILLLYTRAPRVVNPPVCFLHAMVWVVSGAAASKYDPGLVCWIILLYTPSSGRFRRSSRACPLTPLPVCVFRIYNDVGRVRCCSM